MAMTTTTMAELPMDRRLPCEVLGRIFRFGRKPVFPIYSWNYPPLQVCSFWRQAALDTHDLFADIQIHFYPWDKSSCKPESISRWLAMSGNCDLLVDLCFCNDLGSLPDLILRRILAQIRRVKAFTLRGDTEQLLQALRVLNRATRLEELQLYLDGDDDPDERVLLYHYRDHNHPQGTPTIHLPRLRKLHLHDLNGVLPDIKCNEDLEVLLDESTFPASDALRYQVTKLELENDVHEEAWEVAEATLDFPRLQSLTVATPDALDTYVVDEILRSSPLLSSLKLTLYYPVDSVESILPHQNPQITDLTLHIRDTDNDSETCVWRTDDVTKLLSRFTGVRTLKLTWHLEYETLELDLSAFVSALGERAGNSDRWLLCPKLEHLEFTEACVEMGALEALAEIRHATDLKITLTGCYGLPNIEAVPCRELQDAFNNATEINLSFVADDPEWPD